MKNIKYILLVLFCVLINACSNDFLFDNFKETKNYSLSDTIYLAKNGMISPTTITLPATVTANSAYKIRQYPEWITIKQLDGNLSGNTIDLKIEYNNSSNYYSSSLWGNIVVEIDGLGFLNIVITNTEKKADPPQTSEISVSPSLIDFGETLTSSTFTLTQNSSFTTPQYKIISYPNWISIPSQYLTGNYSSISIPLTCTRLSSLAAGTYEGKIAITNNSSKHDTINVTVKMVIPSLINTSNITSIDGNVADAVFDKNLDRLYIVTQTPNQLVILDGANNTTSKISLMKTPGCIKLSEDGSRIFIGQNHLLSIMDAYSQTITKSIDLTIDVFDMMYGENNWCYLIAKNNGLDTSSDGSRYVNIETGNTISPTVSYANYYQKIEQSAHILKVRNKKQAIITRTKTSPEGLSLFQLQNDSLKVVKYWHESTGSKFWSSEDGAFVLGSGGYCIEPNSIGQTNLNVLGKLIPDNTSYSYYTYQWLDHCKATGSIWGIYGSGQTYDQAKVIEFDDTNFNKKQTLSFTTDYITVLNGVIGKYESEPCYIFSNKVGNKVFLIKNLKTKYNTSAWSIETINLNR